MLANNNKIMMPLAMANGSHHGIESLQKVMFSMLARVASNVMKPKWQSSPGSSSISSVTSQLTGFARLHLVTVHSVELFTVISVELSGTLKQ